MTGGKNILKLTKKKNLILKKKISLNDVRKFSKLVGDKHKLHFDKKFSKEKGFKNIVVQGLFISSLCSSFVFKIFGNNMIIIDQKFNYRKPVYIEEILNITGYLQLLDKRFEIYEIKFIIKVGKILTSQGKIIVKLI